MEVSQIPNEQKELTALFFSHQDRLRTSLIKKYNILLKSSGAKGLDEKVQFFNGCILYLKIYKKDIKDIKWSFDLSMIYNGDESKRKNKPYFKTPNDPNLNGSQDKPFKTPLLSLSSSEVSQAFKDLNLGDLDQSKTYNLFFIRHGQAIHNVFTPNFKINTELTTTELLNESKMVGTGGTEQALNSGVFFAQWALNYTNLRKIDYVCVSDLLRTQQTAAWFLTGIEKINEENSKVYSIEGTIQQQQYGGQNSDNIIDISNIYVFVIPCLHEIEKGTDDGKSFTSLKAVGTLTSALSLGTTSGITSRENITNCRSNNYNQNYRFFKDPSFTIKDCTFLTPYVPSTKIDWGNYNEFYNGYRDENKIGRKSCKNTHFLTLFFQYLNRKNGITPVMQTTPIPRKSSYEYTSFPRPESKGFLNGLSSRIFGSRKGGKYTKTKKARKIKMQRKTKKARKTKMQRKTRKH